MSALMRSWVAGQLKYASQITGFLAPYINSYKRFQVGTFAPTRAIWSRDNRTAGFRLCAEGSKGIRIECRIGGADLNPYLAFAALLMAGLDGIKNKIEPPTPVDKDLYELPPDEMADIDQVPTSLNAVMDNLNRPQVPFEAAMNDTRMKFGGVKSH